MKNYHRKDERVMVQIVEDKESGSCIDESLRISKRRLKGDKAAKFARLRKAVIEKGRCSSCGACVASCPPRVLEMIDERPTLVGKCDACGICYHQCPKTLTTSLQLIGDYEAAFRGQTLLPEVTRRQDGGIVTSLLVYLFRENLIDAAVVTMRDPDAVWKPKPSIVTSAEEVLEASGSVYSQSTSVGKLLEAIQQGHHSIAYVGTPCGIDAVSKMQNSPVGLVRLFMRAQILKIGLFCMDAFNYDRLKEFLEEDAKIPLDTIEKMTIVKGKFKVICCGGEEREWPVSSMDPLRASSCHMCTDLTAENADISVGSVGAPEGKNAILARTGLGLEILQDAADNEYIEIEAFPSKRMKPILSLADMKKVQLYNIARRRQFVLQDQIAPTIPAQKKTMEPELLGESVDKRIVRITKTGLSEDGNFVLASLTNRSGKVMERVQIRISQIEGGLFEARSWESVVREWFPSEELDFEFPLCSDSSDVEFLVDVRDKLGKILTKKIPMKRLMGRPKSET